VRCLSIHPQGAGHKGEIIPYRLDNHGIYRLGKPDFNPFTSLLFEHIAMSLTPTDIQRLAQLSRLSFDAPASQRLMEGLNNFFAIVEQMREVDTSDVLPMAHPIDAMPDLAAYAPSAAEGMALRLRDDAVSEPNQREANQRSAPAVERGLFLVPKVIE
jgi:aspartyl-tRNA(Asn)/glutamyl-tRNA(Gln) amidotransferase subunit C